MKAPAYFALALLFGACAQATPAGSELPDDPGDRPDARTANPDVPDADPSAPDATPTGPDAQGPPATALVINEFVADHVGGDTNEFVEVFGPPSADLSNHSILIVEGDSGAGAGVIDQVFALGTAGADGVFVTSFGSNVLENGTITILLVENFSAGAGTDIDSNDDGQIDNEPWTALIDAVAVSDGGLGDRTYAGSAVLTPDFDAGTLQVGGASRIPDGQDTDVASDWARNNFDGAGLSCCAGAVAVAGEALNTPGIANSMAP